MRSRLLVFASVVTTACGPAGAPKTTSRADEVTPARQTGAANAADTVEAPVDLELTAPHKDYVRQLAVSRDAGTAVSWGRDALRVWDVGKRAARCDADLPGRVTSQWARISVDDMQDDRPTDVTALELSRDGAAVLVGTRDGRLRAFASADCRLLGEVTLDAEVAAIAVTDGPVWASAAGDTVSFWRGTALDEPIAAFESEREVVGMWMSSDAARLLLYTAREEFGFLELRDVAAPHTRTPLTDDDGNEHYTGREQVLAGLVEGADGVAVTFYGMGFAVWNADGTLERRLAISPNGAVYREGDIPVKAALDLDWNTAVALSEDGRGVEVVGGDTSRDGFEFAHAVIPIDGGAPTVRPLEVDVVESHIAKSYPWRFDRARAPERAIYGDQDGNVVVVDLATRIPLMLIDKRVTGLPSEETCRAIFERIEALAKATPDTAIASVYLQPSKAVEALADPEKRAAAIAECTREATRADAACFTTADTYQDFIDRRCILGEEPFP